MTTCAPCARWCNHTPPTSIPSPRSWRSWGQPAAARRRGAGRPHAATRRDRHDAIFARLDALPPGGHLIVVNDHDLRPLRSQLDAAWPEVFAWEYLKAGPQAWPVAQQLGGGGAV